ncbi:hypothetical protein H0H81_009069 [Sphagnurus paluster]|uniref:Novel STAND NTPase 1 domain-containing protein n=1 Tax=Sphagnurus paluster TaxID=117069 RepID=A0A9P7KKS9_9AGAR|nr:hypothetical protein H0H81_009069 [Sphagnurus paluster]
MCLARGIDHSNSLAQMEKKIIDYYEGQKQDLRDMRDDIKGAKNAMVEIKSLISDFHHSSPSGYAGLSGIMPSKTRIFHGREKEVNEVASILTQKPKGLPVCILGPGGMGKTSTALAIMNHPDMKQSFPGYSQVWVPCMNATSVYLLLETLCSSLGIAGRSVRAFEDIIEALCRSSQPLILLLDNFETPWNINDIQAKSEVERILCGIEQIPQVSLLVTMRSSSPPCRERIAWHSLDLKSVDRDAALQIYLDIYGDTTDSHLRNDPNLLSLLRMIGDMPLAITLMANYAKLTKLPPAKLLQKYEQRGTALLETSGTGAKHSMERCIGLSVESAPMKRVPEALTLLAIIAKLPGGATFENLDSLWAQNFDKLTLALETLQETSLVEHRTSGYFVLPVIRRYILAPSRFPSTVIDSLVEAACDYLSQHRFDPRVGDGRYTEHLKAIAAEEENLQFVLLETTSPTPRLIEALITLARHQEATIPRSEVIQHALTLLDSLEDNTKLLALASKCQADILSRQNLLDGDWSPLLRAEELFVSIEDQTEVGECRLKIVNLQISVDDTERMGPHLDPACIIEGLRAGFQSAQDKYGVALCLSQYGVLYQRRMEFTQAIEVFTQANEIFEEFEDLPQISEVTFQIAKSYYFEKDLVQARKWANITMGKNILIGRHDNKLRALLARILIGQGLFEEAVESAKTRLMELGRGDHHHYAQLVEEIGRAWAKSGRKEDAIEAFKEAIDYYGLGGPTRMRFGLARCSFFIRALLSDPGRPEDRIPDDKEFEAIARSHPYYSYEELLS